MWDYVQKQKTRSLRTENGTVVISGAWNYLFLKKDFYFIYFEREGEGMGEGQRES